MMTIIYIFQRLLQRKVSRNHLQIKNIISHGSDCKNAIKSHKAALRKFNLQPSAGNLNIFLIHRAKSRRVIKTSKKTSCRNYANKLKCSSKSKKVWDMIQKITGERTSSPINHFSKNHIKSTNKKNIADLLSIFEKFLIHQ